MPAATCLHYGQEAFEGLKAFRGKDGKIRVFRMDENAKRLQSSSRAILMPELPVEKFEEAVRKVVLLNERFIPPHESGSSLYLRPLLIGTGAQVNPHFLLVYFFFSLLCSIRYPLRHVKVCRSLLASFRFPSVPSLYFLSLFLSVSGFFLKKSAH